jgi:prepilin-type N-terminal cleavage/methylation domain-containing protein
MKPTASQRAAFTLVELLTVIAIIAVLMGLLFPALNSAKDPARKTQAGADVKAIVTAIKAFQAEYGKYPMPATDQGTDKIYSGSTQANVMNILRANENIVNTRQISYIEPKMTKSANSKVGGLNPTDGIYYDPWGASSAGTGGTYFIAMDGNYDGALTGSGLPAYAGTSIPSPSQYGAVAYSYGKDGKIGTSDDVVSWQ